MKVENIYSHNRNAIANQFIIRCKNKVIFQSYDSIIAIKNRTTGKITLDKYYWDYSKTTGKYRNIFLGENKKETENKIKNKVYKLKNLN
jgi:hypothetical protein